MFELNLLNFRVLSEFSHQNKTQSKYDLKFLHFNLKHPQKNENGLFPSSYIS